MTLMRMKKEGLFVWLMAVIGVVIALAIGQIALVQASNARLREYASDILKHAAEVATISINVFSLAADTREPLCSDGNLNELRYLLFHKEYLNDIGRVRDGHLLCTAGWGRFATPLSLPPPQRRQANGDDLWANVESVIDRRLVVDMAGHGSVIVFTSPTAFKAYEKPDAGFGALVLTRDGKHIFRAFGDTAGLADRLVRGAPSHEIGPRLTTSRCVDELDICVVAALSGVNILHQSPPAWLGIAGIGGLTAGSLGLVSVLRRRALASLPQQIRRAVADGRLGVVYQPLVRMQDECVIGAEALALLSDEQGGVISSDVFIGIAEESGLIGSITRIVIRKALTEMRDRLTGSNEFYVSINLAAADVIDPTLHAFLHEETDRLGIPRQRVILEITERSTADHARLRTGVEAFRKSGYGLFIDDFGTGYSSLAYLAKLPISGIKVDRMFTQAIGKEAVSSAIIEKICAIADTLGVKLVVEGIEDRAQASHILGLHPSAIGQGWLFGKPVSAERL